MLQKNNLFIVISILLGFVISYYYNRNINISFILLFLIISILFYILFYYLGNIRESYLDYNDSQIKGNLDYNDNQVLGNSDSYKYNDSINSDYIGEKPKGNSITRDYNGMGHIQGKTDSPYFNIYSSDHNKENFDTSEEEDKNFNSKMGNALQDFLEYMKKLEEEIIEEEEHKNKLNSKEEEEHKNKLKSKEEEEETHKEKKHKKIYYGTNKNFNSKYGNALSDFAKYMKKLEEKIIEEEEEENKLKNHEKKYHATPDKDKKKIDEENKNCKEETTNYEKPDINKHLMNTPTPLNINISYNSQNSVNELDNEKFSSCKDKDNEEKKNQPSKNQPPKKNQPTNENSKNIGNIGYDTSRIYNNSDWIYGDSAWTNNPDYYIPQEVNIIPQKPLNEWARVVESKQKRVCPLMDNTPWAEYKSGDNNPSDNF